MMRLGHLRSFARTRPNFATAAASAEAFLQQSEVLETSSMPPNHWFTDAKFLEAEQQRVFKRNWLHVGHVQELEKPGSYISGKIGNSDPYVVVNDQGNLRAFYNICRHRAAALVSDPMGHVEKGCFVCPYHGWTYKLDGRLAKAPKVKGMQNFKPRDYGLFPLSVTTWGPLVLLKAQQTEGPTLQETLLPLQTRLDALKFSSGLSFVSRKIYELDCNWKVFIDNYCDGGYHVPELHKDLTTQLDIGSYSTTLFDGYSVQSCAGGGNNNSIPSSSSNPIDDDVEVAGRLGKEAVYAFVYPNLMINRYGPWLDTNTVFPQGPNKCKVIFDYFVDREAAEQIAAETSTTLEKFVQDSLAASEQVQQEDVDICESVQVGLHSNGYVPGRYAPQVEHADWHFHRMLAQDLRG
eukprot:m.53738 g.53738  ORF g.53738 m.53738 type:complete len:407 (+) comp18433_c0_seq5:128-1348(+)